MLMGSYIYAYPYVCQFTPDNFWWIVAGKLWLDLTKQERSQNPHEFHGTRCPGKEKKSHQHLYTAKSQGKKKKKQHKKFGSYKTPENQFFRQDLLPVQLLQCQ